MMISISPNDSPFESFQSDDVLWESFVNYSQLFLPVLLGIQFKVSDLNQPSAFKFLTDPNTPVLYCYQLAGSAQ